MVSVIIPLYNKAPHIGRALESVLAQTRPAAEIIVVNDGSTDGGEEVVRQYKNPKVRLISQANAGVSAARNRGIREARHPFIAFLDADDAWKPEFLETVGHLSHLYPQAGAYATAFESLTPEKKIIPYPKALPADREHGLIQDFFGQAYKFAIHISAVMIPKAVLDEVGGFATKITYGDEVDVDILEDADLLLKIFLRHPIAYSNKVQATYYQDALNRNSFRHARMRSGEPTLSRTAQEALQSGLVPAGQTKELLEYAAFHQLAAARDFLRQGNRAMAMRMLAYASHTSKFLRWWWKVRLLAVLPHHLRIIIWKVHELFLSRREKLRP